MAYTARLDELDAQKDFIDYNVSRKKLQHILSKELLTDLSFIRPSISFECDLAGFTFEALQHASSRIRYYISSKRGFDYTYYDSSAIKLRRRRKLFLTECWEYMRKKGLHYDRDKVNYLKSKYCDK